MNISFFSLILLHKTSYSPFLSIHRNYIPHSLSFSNTKANYLSNHFIYSSYFNGITSFSDSLFSNFLTSAISISSISEFSDTALSERIHKQGKKNISCTRCTFINCSNKLVDNGGAFLTVGCNSTLLYCVFCNNYAKFSGSVEIQDAPIGIVNFTSIKNSHAERFGAMMLDGHEPENIGSIHFSNFSSNNADKWIGGVRLQHNGGSITYSIFYNNSAVHYGALWDYSHKPSKRDMHHLFFLNNTAHEIGAGFTSYHLLYRGTLTHSVFYGNRNLNSFDGRSVLVHSDSSELNVGNCCFEGEERAEMITYFDSSKITDLGENSFNGTKLNLDEIQDVINNI